VKKIQEMNRDIHGGRERGIGFIEKGRMGNWRGKILNMTYGNE